MKKTLLFFTALLILASTVYSRDRTRMRPKDRVIIGFFTDVWSDLPSDMETRTLNRGFDLKYLFDFPLATTNFSVAAGLGFTSHNIYSDHLYIRNDTDTGHHFELINTNYDNNKLSLNYLNIPLELRYRTRNTPRTFRINAGLTAGYLVRAHTKYVGETFPGGRDTRLKESKLDNLENFMIGLHGRIGYGRLNFHAFFPLTHVFDGNNAEDATFISAGISLIVF